jgi:DNA-directed RNA polymerase II subunit RPB1
MQTKRNLTSKEIEYVLQDIRPIKGLEESISQNIFNQMRHSIIASLKQCKIYPDTLDKLRKKLTYHYYSTQISPGDSVGIATAQSIGERQTQLALNSFHSTGITTLTVVSGVPRFNELVNTTKNPKHVLTSIYIKEKQEYIQDIRSKGIYIQHITLKDVVKTTNTFTKSKTLDDWYLFFKTIYPNIYSKISSCTHYLRYTCDIHKLYIYKINLYDIATVIDDKIADVVCAWSPDEVGVIDIWFNVRELEIPKTISYITSENKYLIYTEEIIIPNLQTLTLRGVEGIEQINYVQKNSEWMIEAMGFNLQKLFSIDEIDETRTISNHMWEIFNVLGIEATREFLIQEFVSVISVDSYINLRHIQLLVDVMLYTGTISSISRYGVHKNQSGALTKCSFEESLDQILKAGIYGENEHITGVSGAIICGKVSAIGTGLCDLVYKSS